MSARVALITGGARGIGFACARRLAADGVRCALLDLDRDATARAAERLPGEHIAVAADVADEAAARSAAAEAAARLGPVDVLVNSAGIVGPTIATAELAGADFRRVLEVNVLGTWAACAAVTPGMVARGWGRVVNIASIAGKEGNPRMAAYSAAKAAVIGLTKSLGKELATTGVLVNAIAPAVIETDMNRDVAPEVQAYMVSRIPMGRLGRPEEVAELVAFLASDRLAFSTGAVYDISGGRATY